MVILKVKTNWPSFYPSATHWFANVGGTIISDYWNPYSESDPFSAGYQDTYLVLFFYDGSMYIPLLTFDNYVNYIDGNTYEWDVGANSVSVVGGAPPPTPVLIAPTEGSNVPGSGIAFSWNPSTGADRYRIEIAKGGFSEGSWLTFQTSVYIDYDNFGYVFPNDGSVYSWRVQAGNASDQWSAWSSWINFVNGSPAVPYPPLLSSPADGEVVPGPSITFIWNPSVGATKYWLHVYDTVVGADVYSADVGNVTTKTLNLTPNDGRTLQWWVQAGNASGWGNNSEFWAVVNGGVIPPASFQGLSTSYSKL